MCVCARARTSERALGRGRPHHDERGSGAQQRARRSPPRPGPVVSLRSPSGERVCQRAFYHPYRTTLFLSLSFSLYTPPRGARFVLACVYACVRAVQLRIHTNRPKSTAPVAFMDFSVAYRRKITVNVPRRLCARLRSVK